jgi:hypothetical protein
MSFFRSSLFVLSEYLTGCCDLEEELSPNEALVAISMNPACAPVI